MRKLGCGESGVCLRRTWLEGEGVQGKMVLKLRSTKLTTDIRSHRSCSVCLDTARVVPVRPEVAPDRDGIGTETAPFRDPMLNPAMLRSPEPAAGCKEPLRPAPLPLPLYYRGTNKGVD